MWTVGKWSPYKALPWAMHPKFMSVETQKSFPYIYIKPQVHQSVKNFSNHFLNSWRFLLHTIPRWSRFKLYDGGLPSAHSLSTKTKHIYWPFVSYPLSVCSPTFLFYDRFLHCPYEHWSLERPSVFCEVWLVFTNLGWLFHNVLTTSVCQLILFFKLFFCTFQYIITCPV